MLHVISHIERIAIATEDAGESEDDGREFFKKSMEAKDAAAI